MKLPISLIVGSAFALVPFALAQTAASPAAPVVSSPYTQPNNAWITISGKVTATSADAFVLDYGKGSITVEMDDYDWYAEGSDILINDNVIVSGKIDHDAGETRSIEAASVYVKNARLSFFADASDEEGGTRGAKRPVVNTDYPVFSYTGTVVSTAKENLVLDTGYQLLTVNFSAYTENVFDQAGKVRIAPGDRISVKGKITEGYFGAASLDATGVAELAE